eukprot:scaffold27689_cov100-Isochrysis_galbana.AAC.1
MGVCERWAPLGRGTIKYNRGTVKCNRRIVKYNRGTVKCNRRIVQYNRRHRVSRAADAPSVTRGS